MAKCFTIFLLLLCLALENNSIARSHPSNREPESAGLHTLVRQSQYEQQTKHSAAAHPAKQHDAHHQQTPLQQQRRHETQAHQRARNRESETNEAPDEDNNNFNRRYYARLRRHLAHQEAHREKQERIYQRQTVFSNTRGQQQGRARVPSEELKTMPRIWQHLIDVDYEDVELDYDESNEEYRMFGDDATPQAMSQDLALDPLQRSIHEANEELSVPALVSMVSVEENQIDVEPPPVHPIDTKILAEIAIPQHLTNHNTSQTEPLDAKNLEVNPRTPSNTTETIKPATGGCPKCESNQQVAHITEEELTLLRIEFVKQQILEKLRLKERPNVSAVGLPKPIYEGVTIEPQEDGSKNKDLDDYYARTSKKFIFLKREQRECQRLSAHPSMCFSFKIDDADADAFDVNTAVLWIYKNKQNRSAIRNETHLAQHSIVVSEVQQQLNSHYLPVAKTIAIQTVDVQDEWMKIDIEWPIKRWFGNHDLSHLIQISCESCDNESMDEMISVDKDYRPFIMVDTQNRRRQTRSKRSINCSNGVTECCREKLYISFDEIGWGDWIIQPRGYDAYFCRGSCSTVASVTQSSSHHSSFLARVLSTKRGQKPLELIPCCTAKQYSSLQLVFMDSNNTATQKTFPNMVVESCGCR